MGKNHDNGNSGGIGFTTLLQILFIALKLLDKIDWSWWWVLSPTWISIILSVFLLIILFLFRKYRGY